MSDSKIQSVQILRFFAAAMVVFGHVMMEANKLGLITPATYRLIDMFPWGAGVDLFFIISGFIIAYVSQRFAPSPQGVADFLVKRLIRIAPLYWFYTLLMIAAVLAFPQAIRNTTLDPSHILASLLFVPWPRPGDLALRPVLGQGWTLNYEMLFYLLASLCVLASRAWREWLLAGAILVTILVGLMLPDKSVASAFLSHTILIEFVFGILLFKAFAARPSLPVPVCLGLIGAGLLAWFVLEPLVSDYWRGFGRGVPALLVSAGIIFSGGFLPEQGPARRLSILLGDASYSLYLSHTFVIIPLGHIWRALGIGMPALYVAVATFAAFAASIVSYLVIERSLAAIFRVRPAVGSAVRPDVGSAPR